MFFCDSNTFWVFSHPCHWREHCHDSKPLICQDLLGVCTVSQYQQKPFHLTPPPYHGKKLDPNCGSYQHSYCIHWQFPEWNDGRWVPSMNREKISRLHLNTSSFWCFGNCKINNDSFALLSMCRQWSWKKKKASPSLGRALLFKHLWAAF